MKCLSNISEAAACFIKPEHVVSARNYGSGHINDTYLVTCSPGLSPFVLQRINHLVFKRPELLMENVIRVTDHVRGRLLAQNTQGVERRVLHLIPGLDGKIMQRDSWGNYWRAYDYIQDAHSVDVISDNMQAEAAARAFGAFQGLLSDLPLPPLHETIPDFHNGLKRMEAFSHAVKQDSCNRALDALDEIRFIEEHAGVFNIIPALMAAQTLPLRVTHNDSKINNVLLDDATCEGLCVIDLDTVMPGTVLYDFGDLLRSSLSRTDEDERDLGKIKIDLGIFECLMRGYLSSAGSFLNKTEREHLIFSGKMISLIMGTRFLTDYLSGDHYYKISRERHNLERCRTQLRLVLLIEQQEDELAHIAERCC